MCIRDSDITAAEDTAEIVLNSNLITIKSVTLLDTAANTSIDCDHSLNDTYQRLTIKLLKTQLVAKKNYQVTIEYTGLLKDDMFGFYRSSYRIGSQVK